MKKQWETGVCIRKTRSCLIMQALRMNEYRETVYENRSTMVCRRKQFGVALWPLHIFNLRYYLLIRWFNRNKCLTLNIFRKLPVASAWIFKCCAASGAKLRDRCNNSIRIYSKTDYVSFQWIMTIDQETVCWSNILQYTRGEEFPCNL